MKQYHNLHPIPPPMLTKTLIALGLFLALLPLIPRDYGLASGQNQQQSENIGEGRR